MWYAGSYAWSCPRSCITPVRCPLKYKGTKKGCKKVSFSNEQGTHGTYHQFLKRDVFYDKFNITRQHLGKLYVC